jgi:hypothetical protein
MGYIPASGFVTRGPVGPRRDNVRDWLVWHFTHRGNLPAICRVGHLLPSALVQPYRSVANESVKDRRTYEVDPDDAYPKSTVRDHVPFYIAAKSPMLYAVTSPGNQPYKAKASDLVFMGCAVGDVMDAGLTWCFSNGNASSGYTSFSREIDRIGTFVDFDLLCQKMWKNTPDDAMRQGRRAAEFLVLHGVPLELVSVVVTRHQRDLDEVRGLFPARSPARWYGATDAIFFT